VVVWETRDGFALGATARWTGGVRIVLTPPFLSHFCKGVLLPPGLAHSALWRVKDPICW